MKNLLKIGALSLALLAAVFMLNTNTNAYDGDLVFEITGDTGYCNLGTGADLLAHAFNTAAHTISGDFITTDSTNTWFCDDLGGSTPWRVDLSSTAVANITTNNAAHTIPNTDVYVLANTGAQVAGSGVCTTTNVGTVVGVRAPLSATQTLFGKTASTGEVCAIKAQDVILAVDLAASQSLGNYSGTLTISLIDFIP